MKKIILARLLVLLFAGLLSCNNSTDDQDQNRQGNQVGAGADTVPAKKAVFESGLPSLRKSVAQMRKYHLDYCDNPLELYSKEDPSKKVRYFEIPLGDIQTVQDAMKENFGGLRIYLGYDVSTKAYHLILTGVDTRYRQNHLADDELFDDFKPCPTTCFATTGDERIDTTDLNYYKDASGVVRYKNPR